MAKVIVPLAQGFEEIEAVCIIDILRRADINVSVCAVENSDFADKNTHEQNLAVTGANGIKIVCDCYVDEIREDDFDMIILPGGLPGTNNLKNSPKIISLLQDMDKKNKQIGAICAAPWVLSEAGVLKDKFTCYPSFEKHINNNGFKEEMIVEDKNILTSRGPGTAICFALKIVEKLKDVQTKEALKSGLLADFC